MGIKGINTLLKEKASGAFLTLPMSMFAGKRIAIDGNYWMYLNMAIARKKVVNRTDILVAEPDHFEIRREWLTLAVNFILLWLSADVIPVFIFDGKHPVEKDTTKSKRKESRETTRSKIEDIYAQFNSSQAKDIFDKPLHLVEELRKALINYNHITSEDFQLFDLFLRSTGIPCYKAVGDGEKLCSMLCREGYVSAVYSSDTDNLVYGCPLVITGISQTPGFNHRGERLYNLDCVRLDKVLSELELSHSMYVDLCIMSGCDYNTNIRGIGPKKSYDLIKSYGSIDNMTQLDTSPLNHIRCRELFKYEHPSNLVDTPLEGGCFDLNLNKTALLGNAQYFEHMGIDGEIPRILTVYQLVSPSSNGLVEELQLSCVPKPKPKVTLNIVKQ